jgi:putative ABC transport system permease protein
MTRKTHGPDDEGLPMSRVKPVADDVRKELEFHLHERARELEARGMSAEQAMAEARAQFGDRRIVEQECETIETRRRGTKRRAERWSALRQDIVVGLRVLRKSPGFTLSAVLMLALGIGANSAVFSIVNRVLLRPLPYENANRIVTVVERHDNNGWGNLPWANFVDIRAQSKSFDALASYSSGPATVLGLSSPIRANVGIVSADFFKVFSVRPFKGRFMNSDEHKFGTPAVAVVSYSFWRDRLGAPSSLENVRVRTDRDYQVIGVAPDGFTFPESNHIWTALEAVERGTSRTSHNDETIGLLRSGVEPLVAQREVDGILSGLSKIYLPDFDAVGAKIVTLQETLNGSFRTPLYLVLGASALVLLAACVNLASAMLARGTARTAEFTVRFALGATRLRVIRQLVVESGMLAFAGCACGLLLAAGILQVLRALAPEELHLEQVTLDGWVVGFALVVAVITTLLFGLLPALRLSRANVSLALRDGSRGTSGVGRMRAWNLLVATEVALAVVLLSSSALLVKSFNKVLQNNLGFSADSVFAARIELPEILYEDGASIRTFHERALANLRALPGVSSVGFVNRVPLTGANPSGALMVEGKPESPKGPFNAYSIYRVVGGEYFGALQIPLLKGRVFRTDGLPEPTPSVVIDEAFAREQWPNEDPIGKRVMVRGMDPGNESWLTIIGVVGSVRNQSPTTPFAATYYFDYHARPAFRVRRAIYTIHTSASETAIAPLIRKAFADVDNQVPVAISDFSETVTDSSASRRFPMALFTAFAAVALVMAIVGIYAVVSYAVAQRTREIGVRLALGATPLGVRTLVLTSAMQAVVPGLVVGALLSFGSASLLRNQLYGISPFDPVALVTGVALLAVAALVSSALPAIRATRVDPLLAMRAE